MYGSIFRMKPRPGQEASVVEEFERWERDRKPKAKGAIAGLVMRPDRRPGELIGVAVFEDKASYQANADDPEQERWYFKLRELLEDDPEWEDGEYVAGEVG